MLESGGGGGGGDGAARREAEARRNKQLQSEIKALETETLRLERHLRARADEERSRIQEAQAAEESGIARRTRQLNEQLADLVVEREQQLRALEDARKRAESGSGRLAEARREVQVYRDGIAAHRQRIADKEAQHKLRLREVQLESGPAVRQLRERVDEAEGRLRREARESEEEQRDSERQHASELSAMDAQVTRDVARLEGDIAALRDAAEAESVKHDKLQSLLRRYRENGSGATVIAAPSNSGSARENSASRSKGRPRSVASAKDSVSTSGRSRLSQTTASRLQQHQQRSGVGGSDGSSARNSLSATSSGTRRTSGVGR